MVGVLKYQTHKYTAPTHRPPAFKDSYQCKIKFPQNS